MNIKIAINQSILERSSTEYLLATLYHEALHAFLYLELRSLGKENFEIKYPELQQFDIAGGRRYFLIGSQYGNHGSHTRFGPFISQIAESILALNPNFDPEAARALAAVGVVKNLNDQEITLAKNERDTSLGKSKGKSCPE